MTEEEIRGMSLNKRRRGARVGKVKREERMLSENI